MWLCDASMTLLYLLDGGVLPQHDFCFEVDVEIAVSDLGLLKSLRSRRDQCALFYLAHLM